MRISEEEFSVPPYRHESDSPVRIFPETFLELRRRARRVGARNR
jgi:hypothetical protein